MTEEEITKPSVVVLGAGPAGLIHAIISLKNDNPTYIIEKRSENSNSRINLINLKHNSLEILKLHGVYERLVKQSCLIKDCMLVSIGNLENALKEIISELSKDNIIIYDSNVTKIISKAGMKVDLEISHRDGSTRVISNNDLIINAEGSHSKTNLLLKNYRTVISQPFPIVGAILKEKSSFYRKEMEALKIIKAATSFFYYYFLMLFKTVCFLKKPYTSFYFFKIFDEYFIGGCPSKSYSKELTELLNIVNEKKTVLENTPKNINQADLEILRQSLQCAEEKKDSFLKQWSHLTFCYVNIRRLFQSFFSFRKFIGPVLMKCIEKIFVYEVGADRAEKCCYILDNSLLIVVGDALVTADPQTSLGCETALVSSIFFRELLLKYEGSILDKGTEKTISELKCMYEEHWEPIIRDIHQKSIESRKFVTAFSLERFDSFFKENYPNCKVFY